MTIGKKLLERNKWRQWKEEAETVSGTAYKKNLCRPRGSNLTHTFSSRSTAKPAFATRVKIGWGALCISQKFTTGTLMQPQAAPWGRTQLQNWSRFCPSERGSWWLSGVTGWPSPPPCPCGSDSPGSWQQEGASENLHRGSDHFCCYKPSPQTLHWSECCSCQSCNIHTPARSLPEAGSGSKWLFTDKHHMNNALCGLHREMS